MKITYLNLSESVTELIDNINIYGFKDPRQLSTSNFLCRKL